MQSKFGNKALRVNISRHRTDSSIIKTLNLFPNPMSLSSAMKILQEALGGYF